MIKSSSIFNFFWSGGVDNTKILFHSSQKPTRKLAARTFIQSQYLTALAASLRVGFCDEWNLRGFTDNVSVLVHQIAAAEKDDILLFETHLAAATSGKTITEESSLLLRQLIALAPE